MNITCKCDTCIRIKNNLETCFKVCDMYNWILNTYVVDFFTDNLWNKFPDSWKKLMEIITFPEMAKLLSNDNNSIGIKHALPLSMLALKEVFRQMNLVRLHQFKGKIEQITSNHFVYRENDTNLMQNASYSNQKFIRSKILDDVKIRHHFFKHAKPKKIHEIALTANVCAESLQATNCNIIIDIGSGLGHLSRLLGYGYNITVCSVERNASYIQKARELNFKLERTVMKYVKSSQYEDMVRPVHLNVELTRQISVKEFIEKLKSALKLDNNETTHFGIVGLHPCGDLTPLLLRYFKDSSNFKFINLISCCYMKMSDSGFPMSSCLTMKSNRALSYTSREMACHAIESYIDRLLEGKQIEFRIHSYRAALEKLIIKHYPEKRHAGLRNVRYSDTECSFTKYYELATRGLDIHIPETEFTSPDTQYMLDGWQLVVLYYSIRLFFAPVIETIILYDRFLFLSEPNISSRLFPIFDAKISPRNHILVAHKHEDKK